MLIRHLFRLVALACALLAATGPAAADGSAARQEIRFAVLAFRPKPITEAQWRPVADYLSKSLDNRTVTLVALTYPELEEAVAQRKVDFVLAQPAFYVYLSTRYGLSSPLATLCNMENGVPVRTFGGVIAVQATRNDIQELGDLAGKRVATASAQSFGGYLMAAYELKKAGIALPQGDRLIETGMPHDRAIEQVLSGQVDAAFVRSGLVEEMLNEGRITKGQLRILNPKNPHDQPFALSTRLYPEWPVATLPDVDDELANAFAAALLSMPHDGKTARRQIKLAFTDSTCRWTTIQSRKYSWPSVSRRSTRLQPLTSMTSGKSTAGNSTSWARSSRSSCCLRRASSGTTDGCAN